MLSFFVFLSHDHIIWKEVCHKVNYFNFHVPFKTSRLWACRFIAMQNKLRSNFPWQSMTTKISHCCCDISQVEHPISHSKWLTKKKNNRTDELFSFKYSKMLSFSQVAEALMGLIYHRPSGENFSSVLQVHNILQVPICNKGRTCFIFIGRPPFVLSSNKILGYHIWQ